MIYDIKILMTVHYIYISLNTVESPKDLNEITKTSIMNFENIEKIIYTYNNENNKDCMKN